MRKLFAILTLSLAAGLCACDDSDDIYWVVPSAAQKSLHTLYPTASNVGWYRSGAYAVADFRTSSQGVQQQRRAWFDGAGTWYMTDTRINFGSLPTAVQTAYNSGDYAQWQVSRTDMLEREGAENLYAVEAQNATARSRSAMMLLYSAEGTLVKSMADPADNYDFRDLIPAPLPAYISVYIQSEYPGARLVSTNFGQTMSTVDILDEGVVRSLYFMTNGSWLYTVTDVQAADVPATVSTALQNSQYSSYTVDDIDYYNTVAGNFYRYSLQSAGGDAQVDITLQGDITQVTAQTKSATDNTPLLSRTVTKFIQSKYPGATVSGYQYEQGLLDVDATYNGTQLDIYFNAAESWVRTEQDAVQSALPAAVSTALAQSQYASYTIQNIDYCQTPWYDYYNFDLTGHGSGVTQVRISSNGSIL